jgi:peptidoglycan/LPS O-acetylase OafA/YrhL
MEDGRSWHLPNQKILDSRKDERMAQPLARIHILQALRTYAALPVVLFHTGYVITGFHKIGVFGVHMFFLLSGYIMASICTTDTHAFLRRRVIRIVPSYWLMTILLYCFAAKFPHLMNSTRAVPVELLKSLFFIPFMKTNGLFQPILFVGWTVNYETFFYVVLALSLFISKRRPLLIASAIVLAIVAISSVFAAQSAIANFYSNPVILEFILGLIAFYCVHAIPQGSASQLKYLWVAIMTVALISLPLIEGFNLFPSVSTVLRFGPLSFLLIWSSCLLAIGGSDIRPGLIVLIGDASYTLYLVHPYIEMLLDRVVATHIPLFHITTIFGCLFAVAVAVAVSIWLYLKVDKPVLSYLTKRLCRSHHASQPVFANTTSVVVDGVGPHYATGRAAD